MSRVPPLAGLLLAALLILPALAQEPQPTPDAKTITLPAPTLTGTVSVEQALAARRSVRQFADRPLDRREIGQLAWAGQGITDPATGHRTAPSAMARYPITLYLCTPEGVFRYLPHGHRLEQVSTTDSRAALSNQKQVQSAPLVFAITADYEAPKFGANAERFIAIEAGRIGENIHLQAVALGLGSVTVGGFEPEAAGKALGLTGAQRVVYLLPVGAKRQ